MAVPCLPNIEPLLAAGIDPKTGLPVRMGGRNALQTGVRRQIAVVDEQDATRRYRQDNLPDGLNNELVERVLYYSGQAILFRRYDMAYILPYALDGQIDVYGRFRGVTPLPFRGGVTTTGKSGKTKLSPWIKGLTLTPVYPGEPIPNQDPDTLCVIIRDYIEPGAELIMPRAQLISPVLDLMSEIIPYTRTALQNATGVMGMRVNNEGESSNVISANISTNRAAIVGDRFVPIIGSMEFQELAAGNAATLTDFMQVYTCIDNYRLSLHGIQNEGSFVKKAHMLEGEQALAGGATAAVLQDGLIQRETAWELANRVFGWGVTVGIDKDAVPDPSEQAELEGGEEDKQNDGRYLER